MNAKELIKKLEQAGFVLDRIPGSSHRIYKKKGFPQISVPYHGSQDLKKGTENKILKAAGLK
ncbi:MAG: type II toxin-antitoxin system HicA family toxin [Fibrobacter sp.]|nr:type II toxin-antitoxin system HicA family toxin [Fibrobacter sp.]